jgi:hypothetical protein
VLTPPLRHPARRPPHRAAANAAQTDRQPPELQAPVAQPTRQQLAGPKAVRERRALLLSSSDTQRLVPPARRQLLLSRSGSAIDCPSYHLYGYDRDTLRRRPTTRRSTTVIRFDDAQRHDARRRHARHPPHPDDNTRPNVRRKRRLGAELPKPVYLFQRPQTCNRCETNPSR